MKPRFFSQVLLLGVAGLFCHPLAALEFRVLSWSGPIDDLKFRNGSDEITVTGEEHALSATYHIEGKGSLKLYRTIQQAERKTEQVVATLPVPEGLTRALLLLSPAAGRNGYEGLWLDDSAETNPAGTLRVYNFSSYPLGLKLGGNQFALSPKGTGQLRFDAKARVVPLRVAAQVGGAWQLALSLSQPVRLQFRVLVLLRDGRLLTDEAVQLIDSTVIYDIPAPTPASAPFSVAKR